MRQKSVNSLRTTPHFITGKLAIIVHGSKRKVLNERSASIPPNGGAVTFLNSETCHSGSFLGEAQASLILGF